MRLFSYVVARDYGFAPNPFHGRCTLATCKPRIRKAAAIGDWVIGTGSRTASKEGHLVYAMRITKTMTFNQYWMAEWSQVKRPNLSGSLKQAFGDNIYCQDGAGKWRQENSHHSRQNGSPDPHNIHRDTSADRVLISDLFAYWGGCGPKIPARFRSWTGYDICKARTGHKSRFPQDMVDAFVAWFHSLAVSGFLSPPLDWSKIP